MAPPRFKAVIVGGGVAGLTLANILERLDIDFVLLEAHADIAPQVGASIGIFPNGMRILDQLGIMDSFSDGLKPLDTFRVFLKDKLLIEMDGVASGRTQRLGRDLIFRDRQILLGQLYNNLKHKDRVLTNKRVMRVDSSPEGALVETKDHEIFKGDIVVGADGIWSRVRHEMWRIAAERSPGYFPADEMKQVQVDYKCLFGIAKPIKEMPEGLVYTVMGQDYSFLIISGEGGRIFYFLFERLPAPLTGDQTPRYTDEDLAQFAERYRGTKIQGDVTLGSIYDRRITSVLTPIHEHVFEKWHFGRIITLGDSAHKPNPIAGYGGNSAMDSVATLANMLKRRLDSAAASEKGSPVLTAQDIDSIFRETQSARNERVHSAVKFSHKMQTFNAQEKLQGRLMAPIIPYLLSTDAFIDDNMDFVLDGAVVEGLPVPFRPHFLPFNNELPAKPLKSALLPRLMVVVAMVGLFKLAVHGMQANSLPDSFFGQSFRTVYTGNQITDTLLNLLTKVFSRAVASPENDSLRLHTKYFLPMLTPLVLIWNIEAYRRGNQQTLLGRLLTWPGLYATAYQVFGIAKVAPVYFLVTLLVSASPVYWRTTGRVVDPAVARAALPAVVLAYVVPTLLMLLPLRDSPLAWLDLMTLWQFAPIAVGPLLSFLAPAIRAAATGKARPKAAVPSVLQPRDSEALHNDDVPHLLSAYAAVFYAAAVLHLGVAAYVLASPALSFRGVFLNVPWPWGPLGSGWAREAGMDEAIATLLKFDFLGFAGSLLVWCLWTVFDMRRLGYVRTVDAAAAGVAVVAALPLLGPGTMYAGTWYWRERVISRLAQLEDRGGKK